MTNVSLTNGVCSHTLAICPVVIGDHPRRVQHNLFVSKTTESLRPAFMRAFLLFIIKYGIILIGQIFPFQSINPYRSITMQCIWRWFASMLLFLSGIALAAEGPEPLVVNSYQEGRFTVEVLVTGGQRVVGGEFVPATFMPQVPSAVLKRTGKPAQHVFFINYRSKELQYYRRETGGSYTGVIGFAVVTPEAEFLPRDIVRGEVTQLVEKPTWCPKVGGQVRKAHPELPPGCLPYGHPLNSMGDWRFDLAWDVPSWSLVRLHGTTGYPQGEFWDAETYGCTRLENRALARLIELLGPQAVAEGIEVVVHRAVRSLATFGR
jgi:hypothetical protein